MQIRIRDLVNPWIRDPGWKKLNPGSGIYIPDPQHCLLVLVLVCTLLSGPVAMCMLHVPDVLVS